MSPHSIEVTTADFDQAVLEASKTVPVLVDFWAEWCGPCRALKPVLEKLATEYQGKFILAKVNSDENQELAQRYGVRGIPNVKAFVNGELAEILRRAAGTAGAGIPHPHTTVACREDTPGCTRTVRGNRRRTAGPGNAGAGVATGSGQRDRAHG